MNDPTVCRCDGILCNESHPLQHEDLGEPGFAPGRWPGWIYVDLNRPDFPRDLRFCGVLCLEAWMEHMRDREYTTRLDAYLGQLDARARHERQIKAVDA